MNNDNFLIVILLAVIAACLLFGGSNVLVTLYWVGGVALAIIAVAIVVWVLISIYENNKPTDQIPQWEPAKSAPLLPSSAPKEDKPVTLGGALLKCVMFFALFMLVLYAIHYLTDPTHWHPG